MKLLEKRALQRKINTLELENERLTQIIKDELFKNFMQDLLKDEQIEALKKENERYRNKIKELKNDRIDK